MVILYKNLLFNFFLLAESDQLAIKAAHGKTLRSSVIKILSQCAVSLLY